VWLPLLNHAGRQARLIDLDDGIPDPWRQYREGRACERREAAKRERALRRAGKDNDAVDVGADEEALW
jgi:hypothetical protein